MCIKEFFELLADITDPSEMEEQSQISEGWKPLFDAIEYELKTLTTREEKIIRLYYGLDDGEKKTLEQIGAVACVGASSPANRAEDNRRNALRKLRSPIRIKRMQGCLRKND